MQCQRSGERFTFVADLLLAVSCYEPAATEEHDDPDSINVDPQFVLDLDHTLQRIQNKISGELQLRRISDLSYWLDIASWDPPDAVLATDLVLCLLFPAQKLITHIKKRLNM